MLILALDTGVLVLFAVLAAYLVFLSRRLVHMRAALAEAGQTLPALGSAVTRMEDATRTLSKRIRTEMEVIDTRLAGMKRIAADLVGAEQVKAELERQMRQVKRIEAGRLAAIPRELAEPKGLAERLAETQPAAALTYAPDAAAASASEPAAGGRTISINMI